MLSRRNLVAALSAATAAFPVSQALAIRSATPVADRLEHAFRTGQRIHGEYLVVERSIVLVGHSGGELSGSHLVFKNRVEGVAAITVIDSAGGQQCRIIDNRLSFPS